MSFITNIDKPLKRWSKNASEAWFLRLSNWRASLRDCGGRFGREGDFFSYKEAERTLLFPSRSRGVNSYVDGLRRRADKLAADYMIDRIAFRPGDRVVDCGANVGDLRLWFDFHGHAIRYFGIEPGATEFSCLQANVANGEVLKAALWNADGEMEFFVNFEDADSSLIKIGEYAQVDRVHSRRLDRLSEVEGPIRLFKVEAEGAEPEVLEGASGRLAQIDYIAVDSGPERGLSKEETTGSCVNFLVRHGFDLIGMRHDRVCLLFQRSDLLDEKNSADASSALGNSD